MIILSSPDECHKLADHWSHETVGFVPTMGNLHAGHLSLVDAAQQQCDKVVVSIFVNPTQFAPHEDFDSYPRTLENDLDLLDPLGVDAVFLPGSSLYPLGTECLRISNLQLKDKLCGQSRPHFFDGVCTVVMKLLQCIRPEKAFFGEKDRQQLMIIQQMVADLFVPTEVIGCPTVREEDGLAMSSRNQYLSAEERKIAPLLYQTLLALQPENIQAACDKLTKAGFEVDYLTCCDPVTLEPTKNTPCVVFAAATLGKTRLIDNIVIRTN